MEKPLLYSNIPLAVDGFTPLTLDLIQRKERFRYGSVIYVCESSLVADSMSFKDPLLNENMLLLNKLIAHETRGGYIFTILKVLTIITLLLNVLCLLIFSYII